MRFKNICLTAMMLLSFCAAENRAQEVFQKEYFVPEIDIREFGSKLIQTSDSGFCRASTPVFYKGDSAISGIGLLKTKINGKVDWFRLITSDEGLKYSAELHPYDMIRMQDGGFCIAGRLRTANVDGAASYRGLLIRTDNSGEVLWAKKYTDSLGYNTRGWITKVIEGYNGGIMIAAEYAGTSNRVFAALDNKGNIGCERKFF